MQLYIFFADEILPYTSVKVRLGDKKLNLDFQETDMRLQVQTKR